MLYIQQNKYQYLHKKGTNIMIQINEMSRDFNNVEKYLMTIAPSIVTLKDVETGTKITVDGWMFFTDVKESTGEEVEVMSIITPDKQVYSCQSATFKKSVRDIATIMEGKPFTIIKTDGTTNSGRKYINCILDIESLS